MRRISLLLCFVLPAILLSACGGGSEGQTNKVSQSAGNLMLDASHGGDGYAWGLADCSTCHALQVIHGRVDLIRDIVRRKGYSTCTGCHGRNGSSESEPRRCNICHNGADLPQTPLLTGQHAHGFVSARAGSLDDGQCIVCHLASDMDGRFELDQDLTRFPDAAENYSNYENKSEFCLRCHNRDHQQPGFEITGREYDDPLIAVEDAFRFIDKHGQMEGSGTRTYAGLRSGYAYRSVVDCTDCHTMHGTDNDKLIIDNSLKGVTQLDQQVRSRPYSIITPGGNYSQLCVLCHQMAVILDAGDEDTGNGLSGVHEVNSDCRLCHTHGEAVQAGM